MLTKVYEDKLYFGNTENELIANIILGNGYLFENHNGKTYFAKTLKGLHQLISDAIDKEFEEDCAKMKKEFEESRARMKKEFEKVSTRMEKDFEEACAKMDKEFEEACVRLNNLTLFNF